VGRARGSWLRSARTSPTTPPSYPAADRGRPAPPARPRSPAEAPVGLAERAPSCAVDRLDDEGAHRQSSAARGFAAGPIGASVLTIHLFVPRLDPAEYRALGAARRGRRGGLPGLLRADVRRARGPRHAAHRRTFPAPCCAHAYGRRSFLSARSGGHLARSACVGAPRVPELGFHARHLGTPPLFRLVRQRVSVRSSTLESDEVLELERYVEELGPATEGRAPSSRTPARPPARRGAQLRRWRGLDLDPVVRRLAELVAVRRRRDQRARTTPRRSPNMKGGLPARFEARPSPGRPAEAWRPRRRGGLAGRGPSDWQVRRGRSAIRCRALLELEERFAGKRVLVTGRRGGRSGASWPRCASRVPPREPPWSSNSHEASDGWRDRRKPRPASRSAQPRVTSCATLRDRRGASRPRIRRPRTAGRPLPPRRAYKHVDLPLPSAFPEEYGPRDPRKPRRLVETCCAPAEAAGTAAGPSSPLTDKAALAASR